jgi:hypothetical protein
VINSVASILRKRRREWFCAALTGLSLAGGFAGIYLGDAVTAFAGGFGTGIWYANWGNERVDR